MPTKHALGFGNGRVVEYEDGSAAYIKSGHLTQAFRVQIADVTGFSVTKNGRLLERTLNVMGTGTQLASVDVAHGTSERIEGWFRNHVLFGSARANNGHAVSTGTAADELAKLAALMKEGVLTEDEFKTQKARLLA
jgi:hypothetical protein